MSIKDDPIILEHKHKNDVRIREITEYVMKGSCSSYEEYKKHVGIVRGIQISNELMDEVIKDYGKDEN